MFVTNSKPVIIDFKPRSESVNLSAAFISDEAVRRDYLALWFFLEYLRDITFKVSDPLLGEIRLKWWEENLEITNLDFDRDPLLQTIKSAVQRYALDNKALCALITAQSIWLRRTPINIDTILEHIEFSEECLIRFGAQMLGLPKKPINRIGETFESVTFTKAIIPYALTEFIGRKKLDRQDIDLEVRLKIARQIAKDLPYNLLPLVMPALVNVSEPGLILRFSLLKVYMFGP